MLVRITKEWPLAISVAFAAAVVVFLVVTLTRSSLWLDELMSLYFSDAADAGPGELWARMTSDLHPPGYYVLLYSWRELFGSSVFNVRLLSAVLMMGVLAIYLRHVIVEFGPRIAALTLPLVVASHIFVVYAQEVRGYALLMLLSLTCAIVYERACRHEGPFLRSLGIVVALSFLMETVHPYGVLWAGAVCAGMLIYRKTLAERITIVAAGGLLLIYPLLRLAWISELTTGSFNWFVYLNPGVELLLGLSRPVIVREDLWIAAALAALAVWWIASRQVDWAILKRALPLALLIPILLVSALGVHYLLDASFNDRNLVILAPVIWLLVPYVITAVRQSSLNLAAIAVGIAAICLNHTLHSGWILRGFKSEWRDSAQFVDEHFAACADTPIPVFSYVDVKRDTYFYRHYLVQPFEFRFVARSELTQTRTARYDGSCPIVFWSPHGLLPHEFSTAEQLREHGYSVVAFEHAVPWQDRAFAEAFVVIDESRAAAR
jgi:uncharacterized membrane protein